MGAGCGVLGVGSRVVVSGAASGRGLVIGAGGDVGLFVLLVPLVVGMFWTKGGRGAG